MIDHDQLTINGPGYNILVNDDDAIIIYLHQRNILQYKPLLSYEKYSQLCKYKNKIAKKVHYSV